MTMFDKGAIDGLTHYMERAQLCRRLTDEPMGLGGMLAGGTSRSEWATGWLYGVALGAKLRISLYDAYGGPLA
jgi:hypothetical protein